MIIINYSRLFFDDFFLVVFDGVDLLCVVEDLIMFFLVFIFMSFFFCGLFLLLLVI